MRKILLGLAGAAGAMALAAPASAQFYGPMYGPAYAPRAYGYGYGVVSPAVAQAMAARVAAIRGQVRNLSMRGAIRWNQARNIDRQAFNLQREIHAAAWRGMGPGERVSLEVRINNLERRVRIAALRPRYGRFYGPRYAGYPRF